MDLITQHLKLVDVNKDLAGLFAERIGIKAEDVELVRKGIVPSDVQFSEGERAAVSYITTRSIDRDQEVVDPDGADMEDYRKNPVVLFGHNYSELPIGKNIWIKSDDKGLIAKTVYANHDFAKTVYDYRKDGFPLAQSIGFIPLEWEDSPKDIKGCRRRYKKWALLEYSDVPVPANPDAVNIAVSKGLVKMTDEIKEVVEEKAGRVLSNKNRTMIMAAVQQMDEAAQALRELLTATEPNETSDEPSGETVEMTATAPAGPAVVTYTEKTEITKVELLTALQDAMQKNRVNIVGIIDEMVAKRLGRATL